MKNIKYSDGLFSIEGAVSIEDNSEFTAAWRIDCSKKEFYPYLNQPHMGEAGAGVRIEFISDTSEIGIYINEVHSSDAGFHDVMTLDLICDGKYIETLYVSGEPSEYYFSKVPKGTKHIEIWLDQAYPVHFKHICIDDKATSTKHIQNKKRWVNYGSSLSHCVRATSPAFTWPGIVALKKELHHTNLGFGGNCSLDPLMIKIIRDTPADIITIKPTSNMHAGTFNQRGFLPAIIGMVERIREKHPSTPLVLISSIYGPNREHEKGKGDMSLSDMRVILKNVTEIFQKNQDENIHYVNGLDILGEEGRPYMPDLIHPNAEGMHLMAEGFIREVLDKIKY